MIIQTNTYICDRCGTIVSVSEEQGEFDDPVIRYPEGWGSYCVYRSPEDEETWIDACQECLKKLRDMEKDEN